VKKKSFVIHLNLHRLAWWWPCISANTAKLE
jgi:hypothetical protein